MVRAGSQCTDDCRIAMKVDRRAIPKKPRSGKSSGVRVILKSGFRNQNKIIRPNNARSTTSTINSLPMPIGTCKIISSGIMVDVQMRIPSRASSGLLNRTAMRKEIANAPSTKGGENHSEKTPSSMPVTTAITKSNGQL